MLVDSSRTNPAVEHVDENKLHRIIVAEAVKAYHSKDVDEENRAGLFLTYKTLCRVLCNQIINIKPDFPYAHTLASTLIEMTNNNIFYAEHLPSLTDIKIQDGNLQELKTMLEVFVSRILGVSFE
jgi:hypothetical protein